MDLRRPALLLVAILAAGCGSKTPASPSGTSTAGGASTLRAGDYTMTVSVASGPNFGANISCFVSSVSFLGSPGTIPGEVITFPVVVTADGARFVLRASGAGDMGLLATVTPTSAGFTGPLSGKVRATDTGVVATFSPTPANPATGAAALDAALIGLGTSDLSGAITGTVDYSTNGGGRNCNGASWSMTPR